MSISNISLNNNVSTTPDAPSIALPKEIIALICSYLNSRDTVQLALTKKSFYFLASNSPFAASLWDLFLRRDFPGSYTSPKPKTENFPLYKRLKTVIDNMKTGSYRFQALNGHREPLNGYSGGAVTCMKILDGKLIAGLRRGMVKIWDLPTGKELLTLNENQIIHQGEIECIKILDGTLIAGSYDRTIKIWDFSTGKELKTLNGHQGRIRCLKILDGKLISGSDDGTIKIWDLNTGELLQTLSGHQGGIICMKILDGTLISGGYDRTIKTWDLSTGEELLTLNGHEDWIMCLKVLDRKLISGSDDGTIKIWDPSTGELLQTLSGHQVGITCVKILDGKLISGSQDGKIKIWDLNTGQELLTLNGYFREIACMGILAGKLISSAGDKIKIWDLSTGRELQALNVGKEFQTGYRGFVKCMKTLDGTLIAGTSDYLSDNFKIVIWDFNSLPLPPATQGVPKHNLKMLSTIIGFLALGIILGFLNKYHMQNL